MDLDRAEVHPEQTPLDARDRMLLRFARYTFRHADRLGGPLLRDRVRFLRGLGLDRAQRRAELLRLMPQLQAALHRRGIAWQVAPAAKTD